MSAIDEYNKLKEVFDNLSKMTWVIPDIYSSLGFMELIGVDLYKSYRLDNDEKKIVKDAINTAKQTEKLKLALGELVFADFRSRIKDSLDQLRKAATKEAIDFLEEPQCQT